MTNVAHAACRAADRLLDGPAYAADVIRYSPKLEGKLVVMGEMPPAAIEQYRRLAAKLHHSQIEQGTKVIMLTSAVPGEGKTLTAANLALTLSESYRRQVLLIDADLRRPAMSDVFQLPNMIGLSDWLKTSDGRKLATVKISEHLAYIPAGHPNPDPMSGLTSDRMLWLLREARDMFDWVIIDTPPVGLLSDANLLCRSVDSAFLVVRAGVTPHELVQRAVQAVGQDRLFGVVLNQINEQHAGRHYGYGSYRGYYGHIKEEGVKSRA